MTFVTHVHPDPDGLGSMMGLAHLVETKLGKRTRLTRDGLISRAENRTMVELLDLDLVSISRLSWDCKGEAVVMVDSQPKTGRHNIDPCIPLYAVIDHHDTPGDTTGAILQEEHEGEDRDRDGEPERAGHRPRRNHREHDHRRARPVGHRRHPQEDAERDIAVPAH